MQIKSAQRLFLIAGIYGLIVITPMFFLEKMIGRYDPPDDISHPMFYYGFAFAALAWQIVYLMMAREPRRLRPVLIPAIMAKGGFAISVFALFFLNRLSGLMIILPSIDLIFAVLFVWAYISLGQS